MARRSGRLSDAERIAVVRATHDALALQRAGAEAMEVVLWQTIAFFYESGTDPGEIAEAMGISVPTFYRRLREARAAGSSPDRHA